MALEPSKAHQHELQFQLSVFKHLHPDGLVEFRDDGTCSFCGSLHPAKAVELFKTGAHAEWADRKYGWPHKAYLKPAPEHNGQAKFYSVHLQDATEEERQILEYYLGLDFTFADDGGVSWKRHIYTE